MRNGVLCVAYEDGNECAMNVISAWFELYGDILFRRHMEAKAHKIKYTQKYKSEPRFVPRTHQLLAAI